MPALDLTGACQALLAYVGPGAGLELLGYTLTLAAYALTAVSAVLLWPVSAVLGRIRGGKDRPGAPGTDEVPGEACGKTGTER